MNAQILHPGPGIQRYRSRFILQDQQVAIGVHQRYNAIELKSTTAQKNLPWHRPKLSNIRDDNAGFFPPQIIGITGI